MNVMSSMKSIEIFTSLNIKSVFFCVHFTCISFSNKCVDCLASSGSQFGARPLILLLVKLVGVIFLKKMHFKIHVLYRQFCHLKAPQFQISE